MLPESDFAWETHILIKQSMNVWGVLTMHNKSINSTKTPTAITAACRPNTGLSQGERIKPREGTDDEWTITVYLGPIFPLHLSNLLIKKRPRHFPTQEWKEISFCCGNDRSVELQSQRGTAFVPAGDADRRERARQMVYSGTSEITSSLFIWWLTSHQEQYQQLKNESTRVKGIAHPEMKICWKCTHPQDIVRVRVSFFTETDLEKCSIPSLAHQWILCSEWVPSEWSPNSW